MKQRAQPERHSLPMSEKCLDLLFACFNEPSGKSLPVVINKFCVSALSVCVCVRVSLQVHTPARHKRWFGIVTLLIISQTDGVFIS